MTAKESNSWGEAEKQEHREMSFMTATGKATKSLGGGIFIASFTIKIVSKHVTESQGQIPKKEQ